MTDEEWAEIRRQRELDQIRDVDRAKERKSKQGESVYVNPWWYVLAGITVFAILYNLFVLHYVWVSSIIGIILIVMRIKGSLSTTYFWPWYLISGIVVDVLQLMVIPPVIKTQQSFSISGLELFLFWWLYSCS